MAETSCEALKGGCEPEIRGIQLRRLPIQQSAHFHLRTFRLRGEVSEVNGDMDRYVFVYRRHPIDPHTGEIFDEFCTVASFADLAEFPVGQPNPNSSTYPFFRRDSLDVDVRSTREADACWEVIKDEVCKLVEQLNAADCLREVECVWLGDQPPTTPSESASTSQSESSSTSA